MDNKQNREFYWEVKQFLNNNTPSTPEVKKPSVKDVITDIINENKIYRQNNFIGETESNEIVSSFLQSLSESEKKNIPSLAIYSKNSTLNPFNLTEAKRKGPGPGRGPKQVGRGGGGGPSSGETERERRIRENRAKEESRRQREEQLNAARRSSYSRGKLKDLLGEFERAGISDTEYDANAVNSGDFDMVVASMSPQARKQLEKYRDDMDQQKLAEYSRKKLEELSYDELTDMARIQKANTAKRERQRGVGIVTADTPKNLDVTVVSPRDDVPDWDPEKSDTDVVTAGDAQAEIDRRWRPIHDAARQSSEKFRQEQEEKRRNSAISPAYPSVTPNSFRAAYGVDYDPRNPKHARMLMALHGENTGKPVEGAGTVKGWNDVNQVNSQQQGGGKKPTAGPQSSGGTQPKPQPTGGTQPKPQSTGGTQPPSQPTGGTQPQPTGGTQPPSQPTGGTQPPSQPTGGTQPQPQPKPQGEDWEDAEYFNPNAVNTKMTQNSVSTKLQKIIGLQRV